MEIRRATIEDARGIAVAHVSSWRWAYRELFPKEVLDTLSVDRKEEIWAHLLGKGFRNCFVVVEEGKIIGFLDSGASQDKDLNEEDGYTEIFALYLLEKAVARGLGRLLINRLTLETKPSTLSLWVLDKNSRAIGFYENLGFEADGRTKTYPVGGVDYLARRYLR